MGRRTGCSIRCCAGGVLRRVRHDTDIPKATETHFNESRKELEQGSVYSSVCSAVLCPVHLEVLKNNVCKNTSRTAHLITLQQYVWLFIVLNFYITRKSIQSK